MDSEFVGTQLFSNLVLAGLSVSQVESIATSAALAPEVAKTVKRLCRIFSEPELTASLAA